MDNRERRTCTEEAKQEALRLTETSGRTIGQVADDLGIGLSTLTRWKRRYREADCLYALRVAQSCGDEYLATFAAWPPQHAMHAS